MLNPLVHVGDHGAPEPADGQGAGQLLAVAVAGAFFRGEGNGEVLQAGVEVDADVVMEGGVGFAVRGSVNKGGGAAPVLVGGVGEEDFGNDVGGDGGVQEAGFGGLGAVGVSFGETGEGKDVGGPIDGGDGLGVAGGLGEAVVEAAAAGSADVGEDAVEDDLTGGAGVEALVEEVAEEAAALGDAGGVDVFCGCGRGGLAFGGVFHPAGEVADGGEAETGDDGVLNDVDELVDFAGEEAGIQVDKVGAGGEGFVFGVGKAPFGAGDGATGSVGGVADGEGVAGVLRGSGGVFGTADVSAHNVAEGHVAGGGGGGEVVAEEAGDGFAAGVVGDGGIEAQAIGDVPLPAEGGEGEALAEEPGVSGFGEAGGLGFAAVDEGEQAGAAAVGDLEEECAGGFGAVRQVEWMDEEKVGGELDFTGGVAGCFVEIDDAGVARVFGADGEVDAGGDLFEAGEGGVAPAGGDEGAADDVDAGNAGLGGEGEAEQEEKDELRASSHGARSIRDEWSVDGRQFPGSSISGGGAGGDSVLCR